MSIYIDPVMELLLGTSSANKARAVKRTPMCMLAMLFLILCSAQAFAQAFVVVQFKPVVQRKGTEYRVSEMVTFLQPWVLVSSGTVTQSVVYMKSGHACAVMTPGTFPDLDWYVAAEVQKGATEDRSFGKLSNAKAFAERVCR